MSSRRFNQDQESLICLSFLRDKKNLSKIAKEWGCPHSTIINVLERNGITRIQRRGRGKNKNRNHLTNKTDMIEYKKIST